MSVDAQTLVEMQDRFDEIVEAAEAEREAEAERLRAQIQSGAFSREELEFIVIDGDHLTRITVMESLDYAHDEDEEAAS